MFKFTFSSGNGVFNPFAAKAEEEDHIQQSVAPQTITRKLPAPPKRLLPPPSIPDGVQPSRKRGWAPTTSPASAPTSQPTLTNGWIDTPSRYLDAALQSHRGDGEDDDRITDLPPAKRRKTLTGAIISTAFSAALIGTTVGMTAYRMWRDRGKPPSDDRSVPMEPPPPYEREEWVDDVSKRKPTNGRPRLPRNPRPVTRRTPRRRMAPIALSPSRSLMRGPSSSKLPFHPEECQDEDVLEQQIDWMGNKIRSLIEEGQRALGKEVVVMNDDSGNDEGAVDDGMDGWEEESNHAARPSSLTSTSYRQPRRRSRQRLDISVSSPSRSVLTLPGSSSRSPTSPEFKRSQTLTNGKRGQGSSTPSSPKTNVPSPRRLGGKVTDGMDDFKVIYEPPAFPNSNNHSDGSFQDEDSRGLAERMENIRKAYRIH